jgi:hypothetical protein
MSNLLIRFVIALAATTVNTSGCAQATDCSKQLSGFLTHPSERTLAVVEAMDRTCWTALSMTTAGRNQLYGSVSKGNRWSAIYLAKHLEELDGGELEDAHRALGSFGDRDPIRLLSLFKNGILSESDFANAVKMVPLTLTDQMALQLSFMQVRRARFESVHREDLREQRATALAAIDSVIAEIRPQVQRTSSPPRTTATAAS